MGFRRQGFGFKKAIRAPDVASKVGEHPVRNLMIGDYYLLYSFQLPEFGSMDAVNEGLW